MKCPYCSAPETKVVDSRINQSSDTTRRRRECQDCQGRFTTYERVEEVMPVIMKKDGRREPYSREKLSRGIQNACYKRNLSAEKVAAIVPRIEKLIQAEGLKEIPADMIGQMAMSELHQLDWVAYVRFASVYRQFQDVQEFVSELKEPAPPQDPEQPEPLSFPFLSRDL